MGVANTILKQAVIVHIFFVMKSAITSAMVAGTQFLGAELFVPALTKQRRVSFNDHGPMNNQVLVEVGGLSRAYGAMLAVNNISFSVRQGEVLGFLGPNGAGKTTTMQMITGNLAPSAGSILIAGHDLLDEPRAAKNRIGYLPEYPPLYRDATVDEYLDYCASLNRIVRHRRRQARETAKEKCGLAGSGRRLINNLSKGYQQRVGLAQAIIHNPDVIVLDEPTIGLDPIQIREIRSLIRALGKEHGIILSTHILPEVQASCNTVQIINQGKLVLKESIQGLAKYMKSASLSVGFRNPFDIVELERLPGVKSVQVVDPGQVHILHELEQDLTDELVRLAVEKNWGLYELTPGRVSLEDVFVDLMLEDGNTTGGRQ